MSWWQVILLGIVEGITEFLPVSSTGHLTITEKLLGMRIDDAGLVAFTAVIQIGAIVAAVVYFWKDIWGIIVGWVRGLFQPAARQGEAGASYRFGWAIIIGSLPIALVGLLFKDFIETGLRSMWFVAWGLILWSVVLFFADRVSNVWQARQAHIPQGARKEVRDSDTTITQALIIGLMQCVSLIPGVSRSGSTIAAGLFMGFDRVHATRLSFFLGIPALVAAGVLEAVSQFDEVSATVGWGLTSLGMVISFVVGYASIAWLLQFVSKHSFRAFILYRIALGLVIILLLAGGVITAV